VWIVGGLVAQMLLLKVAGFSIATGALFAATAAGFGRRKLWISFPVGIVFCLIVWLIFAGLLNLSLPAGPLERLFF
jgi:putative tricarboxylic transport membrane protein